MNVNAFERFFYLIVMAVGIYLLLQFQIPRHNYALLIVPIVALIFFLPKWRLQVVAGISILFHFIPSANHEILFSVAGMSFQLIHSICMTLCLIICVFICKNIERYKADLMHIWFLVLFLFLFVLSSLINEKFLISLPFYFLVCFSRFVWPLCFLMVSAGKFENVTKPALTTAGLLAPFWSFGLYYLPIPLGPPILRRYEADSIQAQKNSFISGLKLLYLSIGLTLVLAVAHQFFFARSLINLSFLGSLKITLTENSLNFPSVFFNTKAFSDPQVFVGTKLASLMIQDLFFVLELFPTFGIAIAFARLSGFHLPRMIHRPLQARTFMQYMGSFLYYYQQLLFKIFVIPALSQRRKIFLNKTATLCVALLLGSFVFHFIRDLSKLGVGSYGQVFLYLFIIAYVVTYQRHKTSSHSYFRIFGYFLIHPFVILGIMFVTRAGRTGEEFFQFIIGLTGVVWR